MERTLGNARLGMDRVDHLVYSSPDLTAGINAIEALTGIRAATGGSHPGMGTRNALLSLGSRTYLEIIAPDPAQTEFRRPRVFQIDQLSAPRLVTWAAKSADIAEIAGKMLPGGGSIGSPMPGSRQTANGATISWQLTDPFAEIANGIVPFFIDWGNTPHPAADAPGTATLVSLHARHPEADYVRSVCTALGIDISVRKGPQASLVAIIDTPRGRVELS